MKTTQLFMTNLTKFIFTILLFFSIENLTAQVLFSKDEVLDDMAILKATLEEAHYNIYAYTSKQEFERNYQEVLGAVNQDSLSLLEATSALQKIASKANNGHTGIGFPGKSYMEYAYGGGTLFPLEIAFEYGKPLIRKNWSNNSRLEIGAEVLSINDVSMSEILSKIYPHISAERLYFKQVKIEVYSFPRYYWQVFGSQDKFEVSIRINDEVETYTLQAISAVEDYEMKRDEVLNAQMKLAFSGQSAYLNPGDLSGDEPVYQRFIDSAFMSIKEKRSKNLIIDLRNNRGGDEPFSNYLISYFANRPFKWNSTFTLKTSNILKETIRKNYDTTTVFWQTALMQQDGEIYPYEFDEYQPQPKHKRFHGNVYVLVNRQSHSQSAVAAAQIQDHGFGTIVGEETGDYPSLYASIFYYPLPNTGIVTSISKGYMVRVNGSTKEEGVIPDIVIKDYLLDENDEILDGLLKKIN